MHSSSTINPIHHLQVSLGLLGFDETDGKQLAIQSHHEEMNGTHHDLPRSTQNLTQLKASIGAILPLINRKRKMGKLLQKEGPVVQGKRTTHRPIPCMMMKLLD